ACPPRPAPARSAATRSHRTAAASACAASSCDRRPREPVRLELADRRQGRTDVEHGRIAARPVDPEAFGREEDAERAEQDPHAPLQLRLRNARERVAQPEAERKHDGRRGDRPDERGTGPRISASAAQARTAAAAPISASDQRRVTATASTIASASRSSTATATAAPRATSANVMPSGYGSAHRGAAYSIESSVAP